MDTTAIVSVIIFSSLKTFCCVQVRMLASRKIIALVLTVWDEYVELGVSTIMRNN